MGRNTHVTRSNKDTHFTGALATDAMELESFDVQSPTKIIRVTLWADQQLDWDVMFFSSSGADDTDADLDTMIDWVEFTSSDGKQIAGAGLYRYSVSGLDLRFKSTDARDSKQVHIGLINRNATSKNAGATGEVVVEVEYESDP